MTHNLHLSWEDEEEHMHCQGCKLLLFYPFFSAHFYLTVKSFLPSRILGTHALKLSRSWRIQSPRSLHQLQYPMDRTVCWRHWLLCPVCKCCKRITLLEERFSWEKYLVCADCQKLLPTCLAFFEVLITMARRQFIQNHRKVVTDTRIWPWADLLK